MDSHVRSTMHFMYILQCRHSILTPVQQHRLLVTQNVTEITSKDRKDVITAHAQDPQVIVSFLKVMFDKVGISYKFEMQIIRLLI